LYYLHPGISTCTGEDSCEYGRYSFEETEKKLLSINEGKGDLSIICEP
jgi:hypothetical protein